MKLLTATSTVDGPGEWFTGRVCIDQIHRGDEPSRIRLAAVHFVPGSRTAWHCHAIGQTLHVTEGIGLVATRDGTVIVMRPGDTVHTPPGEWHWHGATAERFMTHIAAWEGPTDPDTSETTWGEQVADDEYRRAQPG